MGEEATVVPPDDEEFGEFAASAWPKLFSGAVLLLGDARRSDAPDLVQDTLLAVYLHWHAIREPTRRMAYAYRTLARRARRERRRHGSEIVTDTSAWELQGGVNNDVVLPGHLREGLSRLPARRREALVLRYYFDFTVGDIARLTHRPRGTVKSDLARGLAHLRRYFDDLAKAASANTKSSGDRTPTDAH
jgi:RNA polymerase sigma factor (sigma-70 family)